MFLPIGDNIERRTFPVLSCILVFANALIFAYEIRLVVHNPGNETPLMHFLHQWGLKPSDLTDGRYVGVLSHMFLHGGFAHILGNMLCLWAFACSLEVGVGFWYLGGFYLLWGAAGGMAHAWMNWGSDIPLVGASGAIAGLMGAYAVLYGHDTRITTLVFIGWKPFTFRVPAMLYCGGWFAMQLLSARWDAHLEGGVAWYAHIGGFAAGALTALVVKSELQWELQKDKDGTLKFYERNYDRFLGKIVVDGVPIPLAEGDVAGDGSGLPEQCPHCREPLDESRQITAGVARCANEACARLVYAGMQYA
ncbi:MAG TPA: rhomboid family intramembrane serine protease [Lacipirellula sp.]